MKAKRCTLGVLLFLILLAGGVFALLTLLFWAILCVFPNRRIPLLRALPGAGGSFGQ